MVTLGTVRFKGRCDRHPGYNPLDGMGGIIGGCRNCQLLLEIHDAHGRLVELIRKAKNYAGPQVVRRAEDPTDDRQSTLF